MKGKFLKQEEEFSEKYSNILVSVKILLTLAHAQRCDLFVWLY